MNEDIQSLMQFKAPLYVAWEATHLCNAECLHCYSDSGPHARCAQNLKTKEALSVITQLAEVGVLTLAFSGGEPLLRSDWSELIKHAVSCGLSVNIGTNGYNVTKQISKTLAKLRAKSVTVSLDSHKAEVHNHIRQCKGLFTYTLKAIRLLVEQRIRVVVGFTPTRLNWKDGLGVIELANKLNADAVNLSEYIPAGRGSIELALNPEELRDVLLNWIKFRKLFKKRIDIIWHDCRVGMLVPESEKDKYVGCGAGRVLARICPDGIVTPCVFLPTPIGSLRKNNFEEIWRKSQLLKQFRERSNHITGNCGKCDYLMRCGGCRAVAYAYSLGDPLAGDPHCWIEPITRKELLSLHDGESVPF